MAEAIKLVLGNIPAIMFVVALAIACINRSPTYFPERLLNWMVLLGVGVQGAWAGFFHIFFPHMAASSIGWQVSPFQYEIGVSDLSIGLLGIWAFWRSLDFKGAVIGFNTLSFIGFAVGHFRDALLAGNFSSNNFGLLLVLTIVQIFMLPTLYFLTKKRAV